MAFVMRSNDLFLGNPFNIAGASLLLAIVADLTGYTPRFVNWIGLDCHIYLNHFNQVKELLKRKPKKFPSFKILTSRKNPEDYKIEDFEVLDYEPHPKISGDVAV